jgi:hypothetical protein
MNRTVYSRLLCLLGILTSGLCIAQTPAQPLAGACRNEGVTVSEILRVEDQISQYGPRIEDVQLTVLPNGRKAVVFAVRNVPVNGAMEYWNVRYAVRWQDDCGRFLTTGTSTPDGFLLNPNDYQSVQVVAFDQRAARAVLRVYLE